MADDDFGYDDADKERLNETPGGGGDLRSPFARDYDRLIYSAAFRRLQGKTQVVTPGEADFFRTRLTHTIEVAQVARRIAEIMNDDASRARKQAGVPAGTEISKLPPDQQKVDPDICEAAAVLHDLGHPPFGHVGEQALQEGIKEECSLWKLDETGGFEGNAQSFRLAAKTIHHKRRGHGLELTRAVLDAALKYPWLKDTQGIEKSKKKWSVFPTEESEFDWVRRGVPPKVRYEQSLESQIMDWADNVAYSVHDMDDWFRAGYMPLAKLATDEEELRWLIKRIVEIWEQRKEIDGKAKRDATKALIRHLFRDTEEAFEPFRQAAKAGEPVLDTSSEPAQRAFRLLRSILLDEFNSAGEIVERKNGGDAASRRYRLAFKVAELSELKNKILRELLWIYVIGDPRMATQQAGHKRVARGLFDIHAAAARANDPDEIAIYPLDVRMDLLDAPDALHRFRVMVDYVSGMTDGFALRRYARLTGGGGPFQEFI